MSIHKAQGMTIDWLEVDLSGVFAPGMTYVALSRGVSCDHMAVRGFRRSEMKTDRRVVTFYEGLSGERGESVSVQREKEERVDGKRQLSRSGETNLSRPVQSCTNRSRQPLSYNGQPQSYHNQPQSYNSQPQSYHNQPQSYNNQSRPIQPPPPYHHNNQTYLPRPTIPIKTYEQRPSAFPTSTKTTQMKTMTSTKKNSLQSLASSLASYNLSHSSLVSL